MRKGRVVGSASAILVMTGLCGCGKKQHPHGSAAREVVEPAAGAPVGTSELGAPSKVGEFQDFEGEVDVVSETVQPQPHRETIVVMVKGGKVRFDVPLNWQGGPSVGRGAYLLVNAADKKMYTVVAEQKLAFSFELGAIAKEMRGHRQSSPAADGGDVPKVERGGSGTVAGKTCELWDVTVSTGGRSVLCVANEGSRWFDVLGAAFPPERRWLRRFFDGRHIPLRIVSYDASGKVKEKLEVAKIEARPLDVALFNVPVGYRTVDAQDMMRSLDHGADVARPDGGSIGGQVGQVGSAASGRAPSPI